MSNPLTNTSLPILVVGATGSLGGKVVDELLKRDKNVRVLVVPTSPVVAGARSGLATARRQRLAGHLLL